MSLHDSRCRFHTGTNAEFERRTQPRAFPLAPDTLREASCGRRKFPVVHRGQNGLDAFSVVRNITTFYYASIPTARFSQSFFLLDFQQLSDRAARIPVPAFPHTDRRLVDPEPFRELGLRQPKCSADFFHIHRHLQSRSIATR